MTKTDMKTKQSATQRPDNFEDDDEGPQLIHNSDSEPEDETSQSEKENASFGKLQNKAKKIIEMCLPTTKLTFPYDELESLYVDLVQCVRKGVINDFVWLNLIRWLLAMKRSFEGLLDLSCDDKFNWILTDFISSFVNYKCAEFIKDQNIRNAERCANEIVYVFEVFFNEKISFILDTLLKVDLNPCNGKIVNPLFRKYFSTKTKYQICNEKLVLVFKKWKMFVHTKEEKDKIDDIMNQYINPVDGLPKRNPYIKENELGSSIFESTENIESTGSEKSESRSYLQSEILNLERRIRAYFDSYKNFHFYFMNSLTLAPRKNGKDVSVRSLRKQKSLTSAGTQKQRNSSQDSTTTSNLRRRKQLNENKLNDSVIEIDSSSISDKSNCENYNIIEVIDLLSDEEEEAKRILKTNVNIEEPNPRVMHTSPKNVIQSSTIQSEVSSTTQDDYNSNNSPPAVHSSGDLGMQNAREIGTGTVNIVNGVEDDISSTSSINDSGILSAAAFQNLTLWRSVSNMPLNYSPVFINSQNISKTFSPLVDCTGNCQTFSENVNFIERRNLSNNGVNTFSNCNSNEVHKLPHSNTDADSNSQYILKINKSLCPFRCKTTIKEKDNTSCETTKSRENDEKSTERSQQISVLKNHINISSSLSFHSEVQSNEGVFNTKLISKNIENSERKSLDGVDTAISNESNVIRVTETNLWNNNSENNVSDNNNTECNNENKVVPETQLTELKLIEKELTQGLNQQLLKCNLGEQIANIEIKEASEISELQEIESVRNSHVTSTTKKTEEISEFATSLEHCVREISKFTGSENSINAQTRRPSFTETFPVYMQSPKKREVKRYEQSNLKCNDNSKQLNDKGSNQEQPYLYPEIAKSGFAIKNEKTVTNIETSKLICPTIFSNIELQNIPPKLRLKRRHSQNVKSEDCVVKQFEYAKSLEKSDKEMKEINDDAKITPLLEGIEDVISENKSEGISVKNANSKTVLSDSIEEKENKEEERLLNSIKIKFIDKDKSINNEHKIEGRNSKRIKETEVLPESLDIKTYSEKNTNGVSIAESFQGILTSNKTVCTESEQQSKYIKEYTKSNLHKVTEEIEIPEYAQNIAGISESNDISLIPIETLKIPQENPTNITKDDEVSAKRQLRTDITTEKDAINSQDPNCSQAYSLKFECIIDQSNERTAKSEDQENLSSDINQIENTGMKESSKEISEEKATSDISVEIVEINISSDDKLESGLAHSERYIGENSQTTDKVKGQVSKVQNQSNEQLIKETQISKENSVTLSSSSSQVSTTFGTFKTVKETKSSCLNYGNTETEQQSSGSFEENSNLSSDINQIENTGMKESSKEISEEKATSDTSVENVEIKILSDDKLESGLAHSERYIGESSQITDKVKGQIAKVQNQSNEQFIKETEINKEKSITLSSSSVQVSTTCEASEKVKELDSSSLNYGNAETAQQSGGNFEESPKKVTEKDEKIPERFQEIQQSKNIELVEISQAIQNSELTLDSSENVIKCKENLTNSLDEVQGITKHLTISNGNELKMQKKEEDCDAVKSDAKSTQSKECRNQQIEWMRQLGLYNVDSENCNLPNKDEGNNEKSVLAGKLSVDLENNEKLIDISEKMLKEENNSNFKGSDICESGMDNFYLLVTTAANRSSEHFSLIKNEENSCAKTVEEPFKKKRKTSRKRIDSLKDKELKMKPERSTRNSCTDNNKEENEAFNRLPLSSDISSSKNSLTVDKGEYDEIELNEVSFCFLKSMLDSDEASNENEKKDKKKYKQRKISRSTNLGKDTKIPDYFDNIEGKQVNINPSLILPEHKTDIENNKTMCLSSNVEEYSLINASQNLFKTKILNEEIFSANIDQGNGKYFNSTGNIFRNCLNTFPNNLNYTEKYYIENCSQKSKDFTTWKSNVCSSDFPLDCDDPGKLVIDLENKLNKKQILVQKSRSKKTIPKASFKETNLKSLDKAEQKIETHFSGKDKSKNNHIMLSPTDVFHSLHLEHSQQLESNKHDNLKFDQKNGVKIEKLTDEVDIISVEFPNDISTSNDPVYYNNSGAGVNRMNNSQVNDNFLISPHEREFLLTNPKLIPICNTELKIDEKYKSNNEFVEIEVQPDIFETTNVQIIPISKEAPSWPNKVIYETSKKKERNFRNDTKSHCKLSLFDQDLKKNKKFNTKKSKSVNILKSDILLRDAKEDEKKHCPPSNLQISGEISLKNMKKNHDQNEEVRGKGKKYKCNKTKKLAKKSKVEQKLCVPNSSQLCQDFSKNIEKIPARIMEVKGNMKKDKKSTEIVEAKQKSDYLQKSLQVQSLPNDNESVRREKIKRRKVKVTKNQKLPYEKEKRVKIEKKINYLQQSPQELSTQNVDEFSEKAKIPSYVNEIGEEKTISYKNENTPKVQRNNPEASHTLDFENTNKSAGKDINPPQCEEIKEKKYPSKNEVVIKIEEKKSYIVDKYNEKQELSFEIDRREPTLEELNEPEKKDTILSKTKNVRKRKNQRKEERKSLNRSSMQDSQILYEPVEKIFIPSENTEIEEMKKQCVETERVIKGDNIFFKGLNSSEVLEINQNQSDEIKAQKNEPSKELLQMKCLESSIEKNVETGNKRLVKSLNDQNDFFLETNLSERLKSKENNNEEGIHEIQTNIKKTEDNKIGGPSKICRKHVEQYENEKGTGGDNKEDTEKVYNYVKEDTIVTGNLTNFRLENEKINKPSETCVEINLDRQTENIFGCSLGKEKNRSICLKVAVGDQSENKFKSKNDVILKHSLHILPETEKITCKLENTIQNSIEEDGLISNIDLLLHSDKVLPQSETPFSNKEIEIEATESVCESGNIYEQTGKNLQYDSYVPNKLKEEKSGLGVPNKTGKIRDHHQQYNNPHNCEKESTNKDVTSSSEYLIDNGHENVSKQDEKYSHNSVVKETVKYLLEDEKKSGKNEMLQQSFERSNSDLEKAHNKDIKQKEETDYFNSSGKLKRCYIKLKQIKNLDALTVKKNVNNLKQSGKSEKFNKTSKKFHRTGSSKCNSHKDNETNTSIVPFTRSLNTPNDDIKFSELKYDSEISIGANFTISNLDDSNIDEIINLINSPNDELSDIYDHVYLSQTKTNYEGKKDCMISASHYEVGISINIPNSTDNLGTPDNFVNDVRAEPSETIPMTNIGNTNQGFKESAVLNEFKNTSIESNYYSFQEESLNTSDYLCGNKDNGNNANNLNIFDLNGYTSEVNKEDPLTCLHDRYKENKGFNLTTAEAELNHLISQDLLKGNQVNLYHSTPKRNVDDIHCLIQKDAPNNAHKNANTFHFELTNVTEKQSEHTLNSKSLLRNPSNMEKKLLISVNSNEKSLDFKDTDFKKLQQISHNLMCKDIVIIEDCKSKNKIANISVSSSDSCNEPPNKKLCPPNKFKNLQQDKKKTPKASYTFSSKCIHPTTKDSFASFPKQTLNSVKETKEAVHPSLNSIGNSMNFYATKEQSTLAISSCNNMSTVAPVALSLPISKQSCRNLKETGHVMPYDQSKVDNKSSQSKAKVVHLLKHQSQYPLNQSYNKIKSPNPTNSCNFQGHEKQMSSPSPNYIAQKPLTVATEWDFKPLSDDDVLKHLVKQKRKN